jgi:hypothetical protein
MHSYEKKVTFTPLSRGRYRCNQTGQILTKAQILSYVYQYFTQGSAPIITKIQHQSPKKKTVSDHPSTYRSKHR